MRIHDVGDGERSDNDDCDRERAGEEETSQGTEHVKVQLTVLLHDRQDLDNDLAGGPDEHLPLSSSLGIDDVVQAVVENGDSGHLGGLLFADCGAR